MIVVGTLDRVGPPFSVRVLKLYVLDDISFLLVEIVQTEYVSLKLFAGSFNSY